ncbi:MAG: hypothetical protein H6603_03250 [Flavobacteriales bacterium]|nr:hypothetical protein [Flavobacteriales bacterium]MCB9191401.1 hypothetical protein [Flavobacteriales bacterium]MCB9203973.1 hypothetical protein [Flavobacteriales bacterium]
MSTGKPRVVKDYDKLDKQIQEQIKLEYPYGFEDNLIKFTNAEGKRVSALPFEAEDKYYLVRMTIEEAQAIIEDDDDYDEDGNLTDEAREEIEDRMDDVEIEGEAEEEVEESDDADSDEDEGDDDDER